MERTLKLRLLKVLWIARGENLLTPAEEVNVSVLKDIEKKRETYSSSASTN